MIRYPPYVFLRGGFALVGLAAVGTLIASRFAGERFELGVWSAAALVAVGGTISLARHAWRSVFIRLLRHSAGEGERRRG